MQLVIHRCYLLDIYTLVAKDGEMDRGDIEAFEC
jgi:hypothetical protein